MFPDVRTGIEKRRNESIDRKSSSIFQCCCALYSGPPHNNNNSWPRSRQAIGPLLPIKEGGRQGNQNQVSDADLKSHINNQRDR